MGRVAFFLALACACLAALAFAACGAAAEVVLAGAWDAGAGDTSTASDAAEAGASDTSTTTDGSGGSGGGSLVTGRHEVLFVGNSYVSGNDVAGHYHAIASALSPDARVVAVTPDGYLLVQHAEDALSDGTPLARWLRTGTPEEMSFDAVVLQEQSQIGGYPAGTPEREATVAGAIELSELARARGAAVVLYMTWGRERGDPTNAALGFGTFAGMQDRLDAGYLGLAALLRERGTNVRVAPVGGGFRLVFEDVTGAGGDPLAEGSDFDALYESDGSHPSLHGAYLASCIIAGTITAADVRGFVDEPVLGPAVSSRLRDVCARALADPRWHLPTAPPAPDGGVVTPDGGPDVVAPAATVAAGGSHTCARLADATVRCWGSNWYGQLGNGTTSSSETPVGVQGLAGVVEVAAGDAHTCARLTDGTVRCWGSNASGQLGDGTTTPQSAPVAVEGLGGAAQIGAVSQRTCAVLQDGTVRCWGSNQVGQLGDGTQLQRNAPVAVSGLSEVVEVALGDTRTCARLRDATVRCWGLRSYSPLLYTLTPVAIAGLRDVVEITVGGGHACARLRDGSLRCWGANQTGALGNGGYTEWTTPGPVVDAVDVAEVSASYFHTCGRWRDGTVYCWGMNMPRVPTLVPGLVDTVEITTAKEHRCARLRDGSIRCWGSNASGQLWAGGCCHRNLCGVPEGESCGPPADGGGTCVDGLCSGCGAASQPCCDPAPPASASQRCRSANLVCNATSTCVACGAAGEPCCDGSACSAAGTTCFAGRCVLPGEPGAPCLPDNVCTGGCCIVQGHSDRVCVAVGSACPAPEGSAPGTCSATGSCGSCGGNDEPCCPSAMSTRVPFYCSAPSVNCDAQRLCQ